MQASAFKQQPSIQTQTFPMNDNQMFNTFAQQPVQTFPTSNNQMLSAFGQQQLIPRSNVQVQNLLPKTIQFQQPVLTQKDFLQTPFNRFDVQSTNFPIQSRLLAKNTFGNQQQQQQQDLRSIGSQQMLAPQNNLRTFNDFDNQQQDLSFIQQPQQTWSTQQQSSLGYSSSFDNQDQQPVSSGFLIQSSQQNDQKPVINGVFMSSQVPTQRFIPQPRQQISNNGGW